jgi:hypothetical protein
VGVPVAGLDLTTWGRKAERAPDANMMRLEYFGGIIPVLATASAPVRIVTRREPNWNPWIFILCVLLFELILLLPLRV